MKQIKLTRGKFALVDDEDFEYLNQWKWHLLKTQDNNLYALTVIKGKYIYMHRLIMKVNGKNNYIDHKNTDSLDNRKINLRLVTNQLNQANSKIPKNNTSGCKGVDWFKPRKKWRARLMFNYKDINLGYFEEIKIAILVRKQAQKLYFGEFAR